MINQQLHNLGAPNPEAKTSPIMEETDERFDELEQELEEQAVCYFNNSAYDNGSFACAWRITNSPPKTAPFPVL